MGDNKCSRDECKLNVYQDEKCVLHCKKKSKYRDTDLQLYEDFNTALIDNIAEQLEESSDNEDAIIDKRSAIRFLHGESFQAIFSNDEEMISLASNAFFYTILFEYIIFPQGKPKNTFFYNKVIKKLKEIHFYHCKFNVSHLKLDNIKCFFQDCKFYEPWTLPNCIISEDEDNTIYQKCEFYDNVTNDRKSIINYDVSQFDYRCRFEKELSFSNVKFKKPLFYSARKNYLEDRGFIQILLFDNCIFEQPFQLNNYQIDFFSSTDTVFKNKSKFEFKNNEVKEFQLLNTNFQSLVDCIGTKFQSFKVEKSIFEKFTGFEKCEFGEKENNSKEVVFQYATFLDFVNFRDAEFHKGLDLRNANFKELPNFLDVEIEFNDKSKNTNRETFRIIKHSFDSVGNTIEANKFFADEMNEERRESKGFKKFILNLNYLISNFGQSWIMPLLFIMYFLVLQYLVFCLIDNWQISNKSLQTIWVELNHTIHNFMPFKKFLVEGKEFISLFFLIIYSILIYNLVIAVKRITKR